MRLTGVRSIDEHPEPQEADDWGALSVQFVGHCKGPCGLEWFVLASLNGPGEEGKLAIKGRSINQRANILNEIGGPHNFLRN